MKRTSVIVPIVLVATLVVIGVGVLLYFQFGPGKRVPTPFTYQELQALHDNPDMAAKEIPRIIACFENGTEDVRLLAAETLKQVGKPAVEPLRSNLTHADAEVRFNCVQTLAFMKTDAAPAVPELLVCAKDVEPRVRYKAIYTLGQTGDRSEPVVKALFDALDDKDDRVPQTAQEVLDNLGAPAGDALPLLTKLAANGSSPKVRQSANVLLDRFGPLPFTQNELEKLQDNPAAAAQEIPRLMASLINGDDDSRLLAVETLKQLGPKAVEPVRIKLSHPNPDVRYWCIQTLALLKKDAAPVVPELLICVRDPDPAVRYKAVYALGQTGVISDAVFKALLVSLEDTDARVPETALLVLAEIDAPPRDALPMVSELAVNSKNSEVRHAAITVLGKLGEPAIPALRGLLKNAKEGDQAFVVQAIALLGPHARPLLPELKSAMLTNFWYPVQEELSGAFKTFGRDGAEGLASVLKRVTVPESPEYHAGRCVFALKALGEMGADAEPAVPTLINLLKDQDWREQILERLGDIGPAAHEAIPAIEELTKSPIHGRHAKEALVRIGKAPTPLSSTEMEKLNVDPSKAANVIPRLMATFARGEEDQRIFAAEILRQLGAKAVDPARAGLKNKNADIRFGCAQTLAFLKTEATPAIPDLILCVRDKEPRVRYKAVYALGQTGVRSDEFYAVLIEALTDKDESVRETVLEVFDSIDTLPKEVAPALAKMVGKGSRQETRHRVLPILAKTGDTAVPTFRDLLQNTKHVNSNPETYGDFVVLLRATESLKPAQLKALLPELKSLLAKLHASQSLEQDLLDMLMKCGPDGAKAMAESLKSVQKESVVHHNRLELLRTLGLMGRDAEVAVPILIDVLKVNTPKCFPQEYRPQILETLAEIGPGARDAIPAIEALLKEPTVAEDARAALRRFGVKDKK